MASLLCWRKSLSGLMLVLFFIAATSNGYIVDLTLVTNYPLLDPPHTRDQYIGAYLGQKDASIRDNITFDRIIRTVDTASLPKYIDTVNEGQRIRKLIFEQSNQTEALGVFRAAFEYEGTTLNTSTVVLLHNATILPERTTLTVHVEETVTFAVVTNITEGDLRWRFNYDKISDSNGKQSLTLANVQLNQTGVYQCFVNRKRWNAGNAIFILHVIRCPAHRWGSECEHTCTECLNGGKCDADSGECVCPPGFNGTTCEHVLGSNRFGQDGSFSCDSSGDDHSPWCRGKLFCLPDPFGCTCVAGFRGISCTTECNPGTYGANCLQECHCSPRNICTKDTGECIDGTACQEGWTGVNCQDRSSPIQDVDGDTQSTSAGVPSGSIATVVGSAVGAILVIVIVIIIIIIIFYKRRSDESAPTKSKGKESDSSPQYKNPVFDQSKTDVQTYQDMYTDTHIYQDLHTDTRSYGNLTDPQTFQDLKKLDQQAIYENLTDVQ